MEKHVYKNQVQIWRSGYLLEMYHRVTLSKPKHISTKQIKGTKAID